MVKLRRATRPTVVVPFRVHRHVICFWLFFWLAPLAQLGAYIRLAGLVDANIRQRLLLPELACPKWGSAYFGVKSS